MLHFFIKYLYGSIIIYDIINPCRLQQKVITKFNDDFQFLFHFGYCQARQSLKSIPFNGRDTLNSIDLQNKVYSAVLYKRATHEWYDPIKEEPVLLHGITHNPRLTILVVAIQFISTTN